MITINIPGFADLCIKNVIFDFNGTLAVDGMLIEGIGEKLIALSHLVHIHVVTGDSLGTAKSQLHEFPCDVIIAPQEDQGLAKENFLRTLNPQETIAIGNGRNDQQIVNGAVVGILIAGKEGVAIDALKNADILVPTIFDAVDLLLQPNRLRSTLRS